MENTDCIKPAENIVGRYVDAKGRTHVIVMDGEDGEILSESIEAEEDPDRENDVNADFEREGK